MAHFVNNERYLRQHIEATNFENTSRRTFTSVITDIQAILRRIQNENLKNYEVASKINRIESCDRKIQLPKVEPKIVTSTFQNWVLGTRYIHKTTNSFSRENQCSKIQVIRGSTRN